MEMQKLTPELTPFTLFLFLVTQDILNGMLW